MGDADLCFRTARDLAAAIRRGELSARELLAACLARIEAVDPTLNAIPTLVPEKAQAWAAEADEHQARGAALGPLHGLPIAHKDLVRTEGIRTTSGSQLLALNVPSEDDLIVTRLRRAGAITIGKTNTPEFGAGSQTFNEVFGVTRNPWDTTKTCGGSSGGAAVALAAGMVPLADGSDMGGSLRNPASFCNVVGLRPSAGRVPAWPAEDAWSTLGVLGPMARTVGDAALLLSALAGPDPRSPIALETPGARFAEPLERTFSGTPIAWSRDVGGLPVDPRVTGALEPARAVLTNLGCEVEDAEPDWSGADEAFRILRAHAFAQGFLGVPDRALGRLKEAVSWNIAQGRALDGADLRRAARLRSRLHDRLATFFESHAFLVMPVSQVPPFDVTIEYPEQIGEVPMETYIDWMKSAYFVSVTGLPAISVPVGFTPEGLPVGLQVVGRPRDDFGVLQLAHAIEGSVGLAGRRPPL